MHDLALMVTLGYSVAFGADGYTWESGLQGWEGTSGAKLDVVQLQVADGPANRALRITQPDGPAQVAKNKSNAKDAF